MFLNIKLDPIAEVLLKKRALFTFLTIAIGSVVVLGNLHYQLATSVDSIMAQGDEYKAEVDQARIDFPGSPSVLFAFESDPDIFNLQALSAIEELGQRYTEIDSAVAVASILNYPMSDEDTEKFGRRYLIPELENWSVELAAQVRKLAMADEDLTKRLLSKSGEMTIANVKYKDNEDSRDSRIRIAESILALRDSLRSNYPDVRVYVVGGPLFDYDSYQASIRDNQFLFPLLLCLVPILLLFCLKSAWSAFCLSFMTLFTIALAAVIRVTRSKYFLALTGKLGPNQRTIKLHFCFSMLPFVFEDMMMMMLMMMMMIMMMMMMMVMMMMMIMVFSRMASFATW